MSDFQLCSKCGYWCLTLDNKLITCPVCNTELKFIENITTREFAHMNDAEIEDFIVNYLKHDFDPELKIKRIDCIAERRNRVRKQFGTSIKCPTCSSTNVQKIGTLERGISVTMLGLFSKKINKSFKCKSCGYTW